MSGLKEITHSAPRPSVHKMDSGELFGAMSEQPRSLRSRPRSATPPPGGLARATVRLVRGIGAGSLYRRLAALLGPAGLTLRLAVEVVDESSLHPNVINLKLLLDSKLVIVDASERTA